MAGRKWTDREKRLLKKLYPQYLVGSIKGEELASVFNRTLPAIQFQASRTGLTNMARDVINEELLKELNQRFKNKEA